MSHGYKEKVTDEQLANLVEQGIANSVGDWLNSSDLSKEREKSTYEYAGLAQGHLKPQGVSTIVDTSTTETVEAYTAVLCDLFLNNGKLAKFTPYAASPGAHKQAHDASMVTNYCLFKQNNGWELIQTWIKSSLLWKNGIIRWDYVEDYYTTFEEYEVISQAKLDELLSDESVEIVGDLEFENEVDATGDAELVYVNVRIKRTVDRSKVRLENIPPENFRISRDATCIDDAAFVGIQTDMTRSEIRKYWPDIAENISDDEWDELGGMAWSGNTRYSQDVAARKEVVGMSYWQGSSDSMPVEANRELSVTECWMNVDRDGDGIAELKRFIMIGGKVFHEEDCDLIQVASLSPIDIPYEFYGLSIADLTRSSTLAATAILRGFVENTYLTNYSPKLADPNVVDFSALQNMKPKQIIPTNGSPQGAVAALPPETISTGTVPLLQHLQIIKEQATGMSKAAQGLNDTLYVSGNSEGKMAAVQSASQKRIQHIARRFAETGLKRLCEGVYSTIRKQINQMNVCVGGMTEVVDCGNLPDRMECDVILDIGENSNANLINKLTTVGQQVLPALNAAGAGSIIKPESPAVLATKLLEAMGLSSNDFLEDYTTDEFKENAAKAVQSQTENAQKTQELQNRKASADVDLSEANVRYTDAQSANTVQDNSKQMAVAIDKHFQEWADLTIKAQKEGAVIPEHPTYDQILGMVAEVMGQGQEQPTEQPIAPEQARQGTQDQMSEQDMMAMMQQQQLPI